MDVKTIFLYSLINQLIYVEICKGIETNVNKNIVYKLLKTLYNLKQSSKFWYEQLLSFLLERLDFQKIHVNHNIFIIKASINRLIINIFVNDIKIIRVKRSKTTKNVK